MANLSVPGLGTRKEIGENRWSTQALEQMFSAGDLMSCMGCLRRDRCGFDLQAPNEGQWMLGFECKGRPLNPQRKQAVSAGPQKMELESLREEKRKDEREKWSTTEYIPRVLGWCV